MKQKPIDRLQTKLKDMALATDANSVMRKIELQYRIDVLLCMQVLMHSIPEDGSDTEAAVGHYKVLDAFIASLPGDRKYTLKYSETDTKNQEVALEKFQTMLDGIRKKVKSFRKDDIYAGIVKKFIHQAYIVWYSYRETFIKINLEEHHG